MKAHVSGVPYAVELPDSNFDRIPLEEWGLRIAFDMSLRGTCRRRRVGCVLVDSNKIIIGTGYNGPPSDEPHCIDTPCSGAYEPSGTGLDKCEAVHAEINAIAMCERPKDVWAAFCTDSPCIECVKALMNTGCKMLIFRRLYPHIESQRRWTRNGRLWVHYTQPFGDYSDLYAYK